MEEMNLCRLKLREEFYRTQEKNGSYSLRAFARDLNVCHSFLSRVISGKKLPSPRLAFQFGTYMQLTPEEKLELIAATLQQQN